MNVEIVKQEKNEIELKIDNGTIAEIMRVYLNKQGVDLAVWRREHPTRPFVMKIQSSGNASKDVKDAVSEVKKDLDLILKAVKK